MQAGSWGVGEWEAEEVWVYEQEAATIGISDDLGCSRPVSSMCSHQSDWWQGDARSQTSKIIPPDQVEGTHGHMARKTNKTFKQLRARCVYIRQDAFFSSFGHLKVLNLSQNKLLGGHWFIGRVLPGGRIPWRPQPFIPFLAGFRWSTEVSPSFWWTSPTRSPAIYCTCPRMPIFALFVIFVDCIIIHVACWLVLIVSTSARFSLDSKIYMRQHALPPTHPGTHARSHRCETSRPHGTYTHTSIRGFI